MIARIHGLLESIERGSVLIAVDGGLTYEVLVPAFTAARLGGSIGQAVTLHTLHFLESQNQGATMTPRLAGFLSRDDRRFFELFTTTKGIGPRKALRALTLDSAQIAAAIADRDVALLQSLPEVGKRTAETIIATLRGKVDAFVSSAAYAADATGPGEADKEAATVARSPRLAREALEALLTLGENRVQAVAWIDEILRDSDNRPATVEELITRVYRLKSGA